MSDIIRIGRISTIDYNKGTASVIYTDKDNAVSPNFPFLSYAYEPPKVDDMVLVLLLPNSSSKGFIVGMPYNDNNRPKETGSHLFRKDFSDGSYIRYNNKTKTMEISVDSLIINNLTVNGNLHVKGDVIIDGKIITKN